jgi:hypothetical protein
MKKKKEREIIEVEFDFEDNKFVAYGYPERLTGRNEYDFKDEFDPAEVAELAVYVDYTVEQLIFTEDPIAIPINLELYYNDFNEVIKIAKEKINEKYYDTLN